MPTKLPAEHGIVCSLPDQTFGYFGWPSVARLGGDTLVAVASGLRNEHICPFGRTVLLVSRDEGRSWSSPRVINVDTPQQLRRRDLAAGFHPARRRPRWRPRLPVQRRTWRRLDLHDLLSEAREANRQVRPAEQQVAAAVERGSKAQPIAGHSRNMKTRRTRHA